MKKLHIVATSVALISTLGLAKDVVIGVIMPMSGSVSAYGQTAYDGIKIANQMQPKLKNGDNVKIILIDNKGDKVETANAATRLISEDKAVGIIGAMITTNTNQVISIAEEKQIPVIAPAATGDKLTDKKKFASRVCFMDSFQGQVVANYALKQGYKTAVIMVDQAQVYSLGLAKAFERTFKKNGGKTLKKIMISSGDKDFKAAVSQAKSLNPDMVFLPIYHPEAAMIARQAKQIEFNKPLFSGDGVSNQTFIDLGGEAVNGYMFTDTFDYNFPPTEISKKFLAEYKKEKGNNEAASFTALGADSYFVMVDAMNRCESPTDSICINKQIKSTKKFEGVSGIIDIDESGNAKRSAVIREIVDLKPVYKDTVNP